MSSRHSLRVLCFGVVAVVSSGAFAGDPGSSSAVRPAGPRDAVTRVPRPALFETNRGQFADGWDFVARCRGYHAWIRAGEALLDNGGAALRITVDGSRDVDPDVRGFETGGRANYLLGNDERRWVRGAPLTTGANYFAVADATSWTARTRDGRFEFAFEMSGDAEPRFRLEGWTSLRIGDDGILRADTGAGEATFTAPVAWQETPAGRCDVTAEFELAGDGVVRVVLGTRDVGIPTFVDPAVDFLSYLGGTGEDYLSYARYDSSKRLHLAGSTRSTDFPATTGAYQTVKRNDNSGFVRSDFWVAKLSADGSALTWCTYLGGGGEDSLSGFGLDSTGRPVVMGLSSTTDFPTTSGVVATSNASGSTAGCAAKLATDGASLVWGTYLPSFYPYRGVGGPDDRLYLTSSTDVRRIAADATSVDWTTRVTPTSYFGSESSSVSTVATDSAGNCYVAGHTNQTNFTMTPGTIRTTLAGLRDVFLAKYQSDGGRAWVTLIGGAGDEYPQGLACDAQDRPVVVGQTASADFPVTSDAYQSSRPGSQGGFVSTVSTGGTSVVRSTYFGGGYDTVVAVVPHPCGALFISGSTFATTAFPVTAGAAQTTNAGQSDAFLAVFDSRLGLSYSTFLGSTASDSAAALAVAPDGTAAIGNATPVSLATTPRNAIQSSIAGSYDPWFLQVSDTLEGSYDAPSVTTTGLPDWTVGVSVSGLGFSATRGATPHVWSLAGGSLPSGVSLGTDGTLAGAPTTADTFQFTVQAKDTYGIRGRRQVSWKVNPPVSVTRTSLPDWTRTIPFDETVTATGGTGLLGWSVGSGSLPAGLTLVPATGQIAGTPASTGTSTFTLVATDTLGATASHAYTVKVAAVPAVGAASPPEWTEGRPYNFTFGATGGTGALTWSVPSGTLPVATALDPADGRFTGFAKPAGTYDFTIRATDVRGAWGERSFRVVLNPVPSIATANLPFAVVGRPYASQLVASGGTPPRSWNLEAGLLPTGVVLQPATGRIAGTPIAPSAGQLTFTYGDAAGAVATRPVYFECADLLDLAKKKAVTPFAVGVGQPGRILRCLELVGGSTLDVAVAGGGAAGNGPSVRFYAADGSEVDVTASLKVTPKGAKLRKLVVPATGRWFLAVEAATGFQGTMRITTALGPPAKWTATSSVDGDGAPLRVPFSAAPGSTLSVVAKPARKSPARPVIAGITGPSGEDVLAGGTTKAKGASVLFVSKVPLAGGDHVLEIGAVPGTSGPVLWTITLKVPKTFEFELPDVPAGDAE